jgi:hypothetical protein
MRKIIIIYSVIIFFLLSLLTWTYAYFTQTQVKTIILEKGTFDILLQVSFDDLYIDSQSIYYDHENQTIIVNAHDPNSPNFIGKLNFIILIETKILAYARIELKDEWELKRTFNPDGLYPMDPVYESIYIGQKSSLYYPYTLLKLAQHYQPKFGLDRYSYHPVVLEPGLTQIHLISGGDAYPVRENDIYEETCTLKLGIKVEVIQANRLYALWGLNTNYFE